MLDRYRMHLIGPLVATAIVVFASSSRSAPEQSSQIESLQLANRELSKKVAALEAELKESQRALAMSKRGLMDKYDFLPMLAEGKEWARHMAGRLKDAKVSTIKEAESAALKQYFKDRGGFGANQWTRATSLFPVANAVDDFAAAGDLIWEVRILGMLGTDGVHQVTWVNARTGATRSFLPVKDGKPADQPKIEQPKIENP
ncbi:MAG: hypothetical protein WD768_19765 [Phycisphaeraceae bacterium]